MSEPLEILSPPIDRSVTARDRRRAILALITACLGWGGSFTWAKALMAGINQRAGLDESGMLGVLILLSWRFLIGGVVWLTLIPQARRGWNRASVGRALLLGLPFTGAMIVQEMGLTRTTEAVNAFLTSLTVLFVPIIVSCFTRKLPSPSLWLGTILAVSGIWLMTGATPTGFGSGEFMALACSVLFSVHIILINALLSKDTPARMVGGQFIVTGVASMIITLLFQPAARDPHILFLPFSRGLWVDLSLLVIFATLLAFGLMLFFQPKVEPSRAALIYLTEPIFAAGFAWVLIGRKLGVLEIAGAGLIVAANGIVEYLEGLRRMAISRSQSDPEVKSDVNARNQASNDSLVLPTQDANIATLARGPTE